MHSSSSSIVCMHPCMLRMDYGCALPMCRVYKKEECSYNIRSIACLNAPQGRLRKTSKPRDPQPRTGQLLAAVSAGMLEAGREHSLFQFYNQTSKKQPQQPNNKKRYILYSLYLMDAYLCMILLACFFVREVTTRLLYSIELLLLWCW